MSHLNITEPEYAGRITTIAFGALAVAFVAALFNRGLVPSMEPRFAEVVREMIAANEWIIPTKNGVPYVEYPVFYYWFAAVGRLAGLPMTAAIRLPSFVAFFGWVWLLRQWQLLLAPQLPSRAFQLAGAALPLVLYQFSIAQTDGPLVFGVLLAMYSYTKFSFGPMQCRFPLAFWVGVTIATMSKGPVGIACTLPVVAADLAISGWFGDVEQGSKSGSARLIRMTRSVLALGWVRGLGLVLILNAPWYLFAGISRGWQFVEAVLIYQNFERYLTGYSHPQAWWYYFKTISYDFFPLSLLLPWSIWVAARRIQERQIRLPLIWAVMTFLFFSISGSKQGKYLLPLAPAVVALSFVAMEDIWKTYGTDTWRWIRRWSVGLIFTFSVLAVFVIPMFSDRIGGVDGFGPIKQQLADQPAQLVHYQWPRSLTLYELGAPMSFVRSSRELYARIKSGDIRTGDYLLVKSQMLGERLGAEESLQLIPFPNESVFDLILETEIEKPVVLLRVRDGASLLEVPETPEPKILVWRDALFDTD